MTSSGGSGSFLAPDELVRACTASGVPGLVPHPAQVADALTLATAVIGDIEQVLRALLQAASPLAGGEAVTVNGRTYQRVWTAADDRRTWRGAQANTRVRDLIAGEDINFTTTEDTAFREFAAVEVLRHAGIRIEELLELLTHLSIRQYQRPMERSSPCW